MISCDKSVSLKCFCPISLTRNNFIHYCRVTLHSLEHAFVKNFFATEAFRKICVKRKMLRKYDVPGGNTKTCRPVS